MDVDNCKEQMSMQVVGLLSELIREEMRPDN